MLLKQNGEWRNIYASPLATAPGVVYHENDSTVSRPSGYAYIIWRGQAEPNNAVTDDIWIPDSLGSQHNHDAVYARQEDTPSWSNDTFDFYLDEANGDDSNDGLTSTTAKATWPAIEEMIPHIIRKDYDDTGTDELHHIDVRIIGNYSGGIRLERRLVGRVGLSIWGDTTTPSNQVISGGVEFIGVVGTPMFVDFRYLQFQSTVVIQGCVGVSVINCEPRNTGGYGLSIRSSILHLEDNDFGTGVVQDCIDTGYSAQVFSKNNTGNATRHGMRARMGSIISKSGTQPTGDTADEHEDEGGIFTPRAASAKIYLTNTQSLSNNTATKVAFDTTDFDTDSLADLTNNQIVLDRAGLWAIHANVRYGANSTGDRRDCEITQAGGAQSTNIIGPSGTVLTVNGSVIVQATTAGDAIEVFARQDSGGALDVVGGANWTFLSVVYLG